MTITLLKLGWIQFLATYVTTWYLIWWFEYLTFYFRLVETRVIADVSQPKTQRF